MKLSNTTRTKAENHFRSILTLLGEDPEREGLRDTPERYVKFLEEFLTPPKFNATNFDGEGTDQLITQHNIPFASLCEHHTLPFFGVATIGYIPGKVGRVIGLSKLARCLRHHAANFQNQERITRLVAETLNRESGYADVGVQLKARHLCMEIRGIKAHGTFTTTTCLLGEVRNNPATRAEFLNECRETKLH